MELDINKVKEAALTVISNQYSTEESADIEKAFENWFTKEEGWYDVTSNPEEYMGEGIVSVFLNNFYDKEVE